MALGHQLRADDNIRAALRYLFDMRFHRAGRTIQIRGQNSDPSVRKQFCDLFAHTFHTGSDSAQTILGFTAGALGRHRLGLAALMAHQTFEKAMFHHARIAVITANLMPASATQGDRGIATPIEENQRLFAFFQPLLDRTA